MNSLGARRQRQRERKAASADADTPRRGPAYRPRAKIFQASRAVGLVAMNFSPFPTSIRASVL